MPIVINAVDEQFAAATGSNVNSEPDTSTFDYPPVSTHSLTITSQLGDPDPYVFTPGDVYTLSFQGNGGDTIENATVIRSDAVDINGDTGFAVVFEGLDSSGELMQVVWTPEFDLETWYWDNFSGGNPPGFYTDDLDPAVTYAAVCFEVSMKIDTPSGPRAAGEIKAGDYVNTRDHGPQKVDWVASRAVRGRGRNAPVRFEAGAIGNDAPLELSQQHRVHWHSHAARRMFGKGQVLLPAVSMINGGDIRLSPRDEVTYVHLLCDKHEILTCQGVACESLFLGKVAQGVLAFLDDGGREETAFDGYDGALEVFLDLFAAKYTQKPARKFLTVGEGMRLMAAERGETPLKRPAFLAPGMSRSWPYRLDPQKHIGADGLVGLPSCERVTELAA